MTFRPLAWLRCEASRLTGGIGHRWWGGTRCYRCGVRRNDARTVSRRSGALRAVRDAVRRATP